MPIGGHRKGRFQRLHSLIVKINVTLILDLRTRICHEVGLIVSNWQKPHSAIFCWRALFKPQGVPIWRDPCEVGPGNLNCHVRQDSGNLRLGQFYATLQTHPTLYSGNVAIHQAIVCDAASETVQTKCHWEGIEVKVARKLLILAFMWLESTPKVQYSFCTKGQPNTKNYSFHIALSSQGEG